MSKKPNNCAAFEALLVQRWAEACEAFGIEDSDDLTWDIGYWPSFKEPRGFGVTITDTNLLHMRYSSKILSAPVDRQDGVIRHEIGHVVDTIIPPDLLDKLSAAHGVRLHRTQEKRADDIAEAIWGSPLNYDEVLFIQTTGPGISPRPHHLGA